MAHKILLNINMFSSIPLYQQVANELAQYILSGRLSPGERLPSIRGLARQLRLSVDTIKQALQILHADGLIMAWPGSGHYVSKSIAPPVVPSDRKRQSANDTHSFLKEPQPLDVNYAWTDEAEAMTRAIDELPVKHCLQSEAEYDFRAGEPSIDFMQGPRWDQAIKRWCTNYLIKPRAYGNAAGLPELRQEIANWLRRTRGVDCTAQEVFITSGLPQARDLAARLLVNTGSEVLVEDPCNITDMLAYRAQGAKLIRVAQDEQGIDSGRVKDVRTAQIAHLLTAANFPTGFSLSLHRRNELLDWAGENEVIIVEDAAGDGYCYQSTVHPTLYSLAKQREGGPRVIYLGSLSQHLAPSLNIGFALIPPWLQHAFFRAKWLTERHPSFITQGLVLTLMEVGFFDQHALRLLESTRRRRQALLAAIESWPDGLITFTPAQAGFQQAVWFNEPIDDKVVCERALAQGIAVTPITPCFAASRPRSGLSLGFTKLAEERIAEGLEKLLAIILDCRTIDFSISDPVSALQINQPVWRQQAIGEDFRR